MITVMGATGNTGREISRLLLEAGERVRAVGRSRAGLDALGPVEPCQGDAADPAFLTAAFRGADAAYVLFPYDPGAPDHAADQQRLGEAVVRAVRAAGVRRVVALSSVGADVPAGTGFIASLHAQERRLRALPGVDLVVLRPGLFLENFAAALGTVRELGVLVDAVAPDVPVPMVATRDVAAVAAAELRGGDGAGGDGPGGVRELLGPCDLTHAEVARVLGAALGLPDLAYVQLPDAEMAEVLRGAGFSPDAAALHVELGRALSDGTVVPRQGRTPRTTTPTRLETLAAEWAAAERAAAGATA